MSLPLFADSDSHQRKLKKTTNACLECHRRKQKCDRNQPCSNCIARNVVSKCIFCQPILPPDRSGTTESVVHTRLVQAVPAPVLATDGITELGTASEHHAADLGYSFTAGGNTLVDLKQLVQNEGGFHAVSAALDRPVQQRTPCATSSALIAHIPSKMATSKLVAVFYSDVNWQYFILEKYYFDCLLAYWYDSNVEILPHLNQQEISRELYYFPALLFQVLGLAIQFLPFDSLVWECLSKADLDLCQKYSDIGIELMTHQRRESVAITAVQTDLLRASWLKNVGKGVEAWHMVGNAIRSAQELELHRQRNFQHQGMCSPELTLNRVWYEEHKRRLWMNLCTWDTLTAMILGRPRAINPDDCDVEEPIECNIPQNPSTSVPGTPEIMRERDLPNTVSHNLFLYRLSNVWHTVKALKADKPCPKDYSVVQRLHNQVNSIIDRLPPALRTENPDKSWDEKYPYFNQQREDILTKANLILMALHRPHLKHHVESVRAALQAAIVTLQSQNRSFMEIMPHQYKLFGLSFYTIDASLLLSVIAAEHVPQKSNEVIVKVDYILQQAMDRLSIMYSYSPIARSGLAILQQCYRVFRKRWEGNSAISKFPAGMTIETENIRQRLGVDLTIDTSEQQQLHQHHQHEQQKSTSSASASLFTEDSAPTFPASSEPYPSQGLRTISPGTIDTEFMSGTAVDPSLYFGPSTTYFDETYWMNLINQTTDIPNPGSAEAQYVGGLVDLATTGCNDVWSQIQLY